MTTDINIYLSSNNIRNSTSVSYSKELTPALKEEVLQLIETFVRDVDEVFSEEPSGPTPPKGSQIVGLKSKPVAQPASMQELFGKLYDYEFRNRNISNDIQEI